MNHIHFMAITHQLATEPMEVNGISPKPVRRVVDGDHAKLKRSAHSASGLRQ